MNLSQVITDILDPGLARLPMAMDSQKARVMLLAIGRKRLTMKAAPHSATNTVQGLTTYQPVSEVRPMADSNSTDTPIHSYGTDGRARYERSCAGCGDVALVLKRHLALKCHACVMKAKRDRMSPGSVQVDSGGGKVTRYARICSGCGASSLSTKRDIDRQCRQCALKARATHGLSPRGSEHPLYRVLKSAQARCDYPASKDYKWYGARGITVCDEWRADPLLFVVWAMANGWKKGLELDRRDNDGPYSPENCRFITHQENCRNRRNSRSGEEDS